MEEQLRNFVELLKNRKEQFSGEVLEFIKSWNILKDSELLESKKQFKNQEIHKILSELSGTLLYEGINFNNPDYKYIKDLEFRKIPAFQRFQMINSSFDLFNNCKNENSRITDEKLISDELRELILEHLILQDDSDAYLLADTLKNCYIKIVSRNIDIDWYDLNIYMDDTKIDFAEKHKDLVFDYFKEKGPDFIQPLEKVNFISAPKSCFINIAFDPNGEIQELVIDLKKILHEINYLTAREIYLAIELGRQEKLLSSLRLLLIISEEVLNEIHLTFFNDKENLSRLSYKDKLKNLESKGLVVDSHEFYNINELRNIFVHALTKHQDQSSLIFRFKEVIQFIRDIIFFKKANDK